MWIDTHCHPYFKPFNRDRDQVIKQALDAGVKKMIVVGCDRETNRLALQISEGYDFMYPTLGVHPCDCDDLTDSEIDFIRSNAKNIVAVGEMGLDYHHMSFSKEIQFETFRRQIRLANELKLPCIIHSRDAKEDTLRILLEENAERVVFHCYTYDLEFAKKVWGRGYLTSFSGVVTYNNAVDVQEAARHVPLDLFLVETDCPFLPPQKIRGKRNEMLYVTEVGRKIAELKKIPIENIEEQSTKNALDFFSCL